MSCQRAWQLCTLKNFLTCQIGSVPKAWLFGFVDLTTLLDFVIPALLHNVDAIDCIASTIWRNSMTIRMGYCSINGASAEGLALFFVECTAHCRTRALFLGTIGLLICGRTHLTASRGSIPFAISSLLTIVRTFYLDAGACIALN